jgi:prepilin-type N-terminal cleavage/methylation domain-containing protein
MRKQSGFTLVEIIVAIVIVSVAIVAIISISRKGREIDIDSLHNRRARTIIDSCFESSSYQYANAVNFVAVNRAVLIDPRRAGATDDLIGTLTITLTPTTTAAASGINVPSTKLLATITWQEPEGQQSIALEKLVPQL